MGARWVVSRSHGAAGCARPADHFHPRQVTVTLTTNSPSARVRDGGLGGVGERPVDAVMLFDGRDLSGWRQRKGGGPAGWTVSDGTLTVARGAGDIVSVETYADAHIHLEFREPAKPEATGQAKGNSGVYLQGRYEIQVLDSFGWQLPGKGDCGAIYDQFAPLCNACLPALEWQSYDIVFRAARVDESGEVTAPARITLLQNGRVIHNNVVVRGPTGGAIDQRVGEPGPLLLQDHGDPVSYRNIWLVRLPAQGSEEYGPR